MDKQEYLNRLERELKGLSPEKISLIVEEMTAHFDESEAQTKFGTDEYDPGESILAEMGSPKELGRRLKAIHHPNRWLEYLLIVLPGSFFLPFYNLLSHFLLQQLFLIGPNDEIAPIYFHLVNWVTLPIYVLLVYYCFVIYRQQGRTTSLLFWLSSAWLYIFSFCFREEGWNFTYMPAEHFWWNIESLFWTVILLAVLIKLLKLLMVHKDPQYFCLVSILFIFSLSTLVVQHMTAYGAPFGVYVIPNMGFWSGIYLPYQLAKLIWPAVFLFPKQRIFRWFALLIYAVPLVVLNVKMIPPQYPILTLLSVTPLLLIVFYWMLDVIDDRRKSRLIHSA